MKQNTWTGLPIHSQLPQEVNFHNIFILILLHLSVSHSNFYVGEDMVSEAQAQDTGVGQVRKVGEERVARGSNRVEMAGK